LAIDSPSEPGESAPRRSEVVVPRSQLKLTAAVAGLVVLVVAVWGSVAERGLRSDQLDRIARSLERSAALVAELASEQPFELASRAELDDIADRAGRASEVRVTLIGRDGTVLGDSDVSYERLAGVANHADRPEVRAALAGGLGTNTRRSATVGRELMYLAAPVDGGAGGVVRVAVDLSDLDAAVAALRWELVTAGSVGLAMAVALSFALSWLTLRPLHEMRRVAASIAEGRLDDRMPFRSGDELGEISHSINRMAEQLRLRLEETTGEKEQLSAVLEGMVEGVLLIDVKGTILLANPQLRGFFDVRGEIVGRPLLEGIRSAELEVILGEAGGTEQPLTRELAVPQPIPRTLRVHATRFPARGSRVGTLAVLHDVTELMRLEEVRRDFVANASHELRTPLAAIRGFSETLLHSDSLSDADRRAYLEVIDRHAHRLSNIVQDLLELSTVESRKLRLEPTEVDVASLVSGLVRDLHSRIEERQLAVLEEAEPGEIAWADARAVEQILTNLLDNSIKYTEPGGTIEIRVDGAPSRVRVQVRDTGIGIPAEDLSRVFERFYRVDKARSRALGGTGLGLSIVKHLVQSQGGEIRVESEVGKGSCFIFTLPRPEDGRGERPETGARSQP
jgi:two-component system phosphate regulon sensor histidine kinase PhoR